MVTHHSRVGQGRDDGMCSCSCWEMHGFRRRTCIECQRLHVRRRRASTKHQRQHRFDRSRSVTFRSRASPRLHSCACRPSRHTIPRQHDRSQEKTITVPPAPYHHRTCRRTLKLGPIRHPPWPQVSHHVFQVMRPKFLVFRTEKAWSD